jgi:hypothetical protein
LSKGEKSTVASTHFLDLLECGPNTPELAQLETFDSGARRDSQKGKTRYSLIPPRALKRVADVLTSGAERYGDFNYMAGMPYSRCYDSAYRHLQEWAMGDRKTDHLASLVCNAIFLMFYEDADMKQWDDMRKINGETVE